MADNEKPKDKQHQDVEDLVNWRKKIEMIGIDIKGLDRENQTRRLIYIFFAIWVSKGSDIL